MHNTYIWALPMIRTIHPQPDSKPPNKGDHLLADTKLDVCKLQPPIPINGPTIIEWKRKLTKAHPGVIMHTVQPRLS